MTEDTLLPFDLPAVKRKKVTADFGGGLISSDGGLVLLHEAERRLGLAQTLAGCIREWRNPALVVHTLPAMLRFRMFAIACGYEDADDCDALRTDPLFKLAVGQSPESGRALCSQPTMSRLENASSRLEVARMTAALVDIFCRSFAAPPAAITLDIDDTCDPVHGHQQLSLFNAHYDTRCFLPVHVYHVESGKPVAVLLRPGKTPSGAEVRTLLKHLVRRIRRHWPRTRLTFRGDSHYGRTEAMAWCEKNGGDYIFGLAGNRVLHRFAYDIADDLKVRRAEACRPRCGSRDSCPVVSDRPTTRRFSMGPAVYAAGARTAQWNPTCPTDGRMRSCSSTKASSVPASSRARIRSRARSSSDSDTIDHNESPRRHAGSSGPRPSKYAPPCMTASLGTNRPRGMSPASASSPFSTSVSACRRRIVATASGTSDAYHQPRRSCSWEQVLMTATPPGRSTRANSPSTRHSIGQPSFGESGRWWSTWFTITASKQASSNGSASMPASCRATGHPGLPSSFARATPSIDGFRSTASIAPAYRRSAAQ